MWGRNPTQDVDALFVRDAIFDKDTGYHSMLATCEFAGVFLDSLERGIGMTAAMEGAARMAITASFAAARCDVECAETEILESERDNILFNASGRQCHACGAPSIVCVYVHSALLSQDGSSRPWMCHACIDEFAKGAGAGGSVSRVWLVSAAELSKMKAVCA